MSTSAPSAGPPVTIAAAGIDVAQVRAVARHDAGVVLAPATLAGMARAEAALGEAAEAGQAIYGVTTGLGSRVTETVADPGDRGYALRTIRGRATAVGEPLGRDLTRAAMTVRLAGLCAGGSGAGPECARMLAEMLNRGVHPCLPRSGSVGSSDLCLMAHVGLGMIGEGYAEHGGEWLPAREALTAAGLTPLMPGPRDGLAICASSALSVGAAALALVDARELLAGAQITAALSMEGFRANLGPLDPRVVAARAAPGQAWAADGLRALLDGGGLGEPGAARRLQDPLSFRCAPSLHGALHTALGWLSDALEPELRGAADSPLVLAGSEPEVLSTGNFQTSALALALDAVALALAQVAHGIAERASRLTESRLSGLPANLVDPGLRDVTTRSGVGPLSKTAHALLAEIRHAAAPLSIHAPVLADGVEDDASGAALGALRVLDQLGALRRLIAAELLIAAQAVDVARPGRLGGGAEVAHRAVRELIPMLREDRPLGPEVDRLAERLLGDGSLVRRVHPGGTPAP